MSNIVKYKGNKTDGIDLSEATVTNTLKLSTTSGVTIGSTMTISPELTPESGFITIDVGGTSYQIPIYAA